MDVEEFYVPDDVLEEASAAKYQMVSTKLKLRYQKTISRKKLQLFQETMFASFYWKRRIFYFKKRMSQR
jgi:hypothetical protein